MPDHLSVLIFRHFYGSCAVLLGGWEALAAAGQLPTITATVQCHRHRLAVKALMAAWAIGLGYHLLYEERHPLA